MAVRRWVVCLTAVTVAAVLVGTRQARPQAPANPGNYQGLNLDKGVLGDTQKLFNLLSKGQNTLSIADTGILRFPLANFARQQGIPADLITREEFAQFGQQLTLNSLVSDTRSQARLDAVWDQLAQWEFRRMDANRDGVLDIDEMEGGLRNNLAQWDMNFDNVIDLAEFKAYYRMKMGNRMSRNVARAFGKNEPHGRMPAYYVVPDLEEFENRQVVYRYGKLPEGLPEWFVDLDTDRDGQIGLYEWRHSGKSTTEFQQMDRNGDGLLTPDELLHYMAQSDHAGGADDGSARSEAFLGPGS